MSPASVTAEELKTLKAKAINAQTAAYCPYSNFRVGACFLSTSTSTSTADGVEEGAGDAVYHTGANVENASYPVGLCAERCALAAAVTRQDPSLQSQPHQLPRFRALAVATDTSPPASPCGMCRQFIREFCPLDLPIYMFGRRRDYRRQSPIDNNTTTTATANATSNKSSNTNTTETNKDKTTDHDHEHEREHEEGEGDGEEGEGEYVCILKTLGELLPLSFGPRDLPPAGTVGSLG